MHCREEKWFWPFLLLWLLNMKHMQGLSCSGLVEHLYSLNNNLISVVSFSYRWRRWPAVMLLKKLQKCKSSICFSNLTKMQTGELASVSNWGCFFKIGYCVIKCLTLISGFKIFKPSERWRETSWCAASEVRVVWTMTWCFGEKLPTNDAEILD